MKMRLDKFLKHAGKGTRTEVKQIVKAKKVYVNGLLNVQPETIIDTAKDVVELNHQVIIYKQWTYVALNKPKGYVCANKDNLHSTILDLMPEYKNINLNILGRLDKDTTGLVLLSNNGSWIHKIKSPKSNSQKEYLVTLASALTQANIDFIQGNVYMDSKKLLPMKISKVQDKQCNITLQEGKFHQIKRVFRMVNNKVIELQRVRINEFILEDLNLKVGEYKEIQVK